MAYESALWPLQKAIYERLSSDPVVLGLVTGVFDDVGEDQAFPYITIGEPNVLPFDSKTSVGEEIAIVVHAWSIYPGKKESYAILNACAKSLAKRLTLEGDFKLLRVVKSQMQVFDDIDPKRKHGVLRMQYIINNI